MSNDMHVGDVGTVIRVTVKDQDGAIYDVSGASVKEIILQKPDETAIKKDADFVTDGKDGLLKYEVVSGDLDMAGIWRVQAHIEIGTDNIKNSDVQEIHVAANLPLPPEPEAGP